MDKGASGEGEGGSKVEVGRQWSGIRGQEERKVRLDSAKDLEVYKKAYSLAMQIFELSKSFTK